MEDLGSITEHHMVIEFVRAEVDSLTFGPYYVFPAGWDLLSLLDNGSPTNAEQNRIRMEMLEAVRGYQGRRILFRGFPFDVTWSRCTVATEELQAFRYANYEALLELSGPSRLVRDGAARIAQGVAFPDPENLKRDIEGIAEGLRQAARSMETDRRRGGGRCVRAGRRAQAGNRPLRSGTEGAIRVMVGNHLAYAGGILLRPLTDQTRRGGKLINVRRLWRRRVSARPADRARRR